VLSPVVDIERRIDGEVPLQRVGVYLEIITLGAGVSKISSFK